MQLHKIKKKEMYILKGTKRTRRNNKGKNSRVNS